MQNPELRDLSVKWIDLTGGNDWFVEIVKTYGDNSTDANAANKASGKRSSASDCGETMNDCAKCGGTLTSSASQ
jgi:hypothetical protein